MSQADPQQILNSWNTMNSHDMSILRRIARRRIAGTTFTEPTDLMYETLNRSLDGRRTWDTHVPFSVFFGNAMRSVASGERSREKRRAAKRFEIGELLRAMERHIAAPSEEELAIEAQELATTGKTVDKIRGMLTGDREALLVLAGLLAGTSPLEMRERLHMDKKTFAAARARVSRRLRATRKYNNASKNMSTGNCHWMSPLAAEHCSGNPP